MDTEKTILRTRLLAERKGMDDRCAKRESAAICKFLERESGFQKARSILFYMPHRGEVDVRKGMEKAWQQKKQVVLPRSVPRTRTLELYSITSFSDLIEGTYGILEPDPTKGQHVDAQEIDLVVVPGIGFDREGYRLGYGGGYYDRFFADPEVDMVRVGVAYSFQLVSTVYPESHDQPVHAVITPEGVIHF